MRNTHSEDIATRLKYTGLIAIARGDYGVEQLLEIAAALLAGQVMALEVTLNSTNALAAIEALRRNVEERMLIGAGTVRTSAQARDACAAGAQFVISPNFDPAVVQECQAQAVLAVPGVFTATEAQNAFAAGCRLLKLFPADTFGPAYLRALRAPLNDIDFVPTGGVTAQNLGEYVRAGAVAVGIGSALLSGPRQPLSEIEARARELRSAWDRSQHA